MKLTTKVAGSLIFSFLDLALCLSALLLGFIFKSASAFVLFTVFLPPLLLITLVYSVIDFLGKRSRQASAALLLFLPTLAVQILFYRSLDL